MTQKIKHFAKNIRRLSEILTSHPDLSASFSLALVFSPFSACLRFTSP